MMYKNVSWKNVPTEDRSIFTFVQPGQSLLGAVGPATNQKLHHADRNALHQLGTGWPLSTSKVMIMSKYVCIESLSLMVKTLLD